MKNRLMRSLPLLLAGALQVVPMTRSMLPTLAQALAPSGGGAIIFRWAVGAAAMFGYHAISSASSIAVSPPNATVGQPYVGTITYSGGHAGDVRSMSYTNACLGIPIPIGNGLSIVYNGGNTATVSGTPTFATNLPITLKMLDAANCSGAGNTDTRSTTLVIGGSGTGNVAPSFSVAPQNNIAQVGSDALLSAAASGTPPPAYYWKQGITPIPGATNAILSFPSVQLTSAGLYTVTASNAAGTASATAYLTVCVTPGSNQLVANFTNYFPASNAVTMHSYLTNAPSGSNIYKWQYNYVDITPFSTNGNDLNLPGTQVRAARSGIYSVVFNSKVGATTVVNLQSYDSYWAFGSPPTISSPPANTNVTAGSDVTFSAAAQVATTPYGNTQPMHFDWYLNGTTHVGSHDGAGTNQTSTLQLISVSAANTGNYTVVVSNFWGSVTSSPAALTIGGGAIRPAITSQPVPSSVLAGQNASFAVTATGDQPLSFQWWKGNVPLSNGGSVSGATSNVLTLTGVQTVDAGNYSVVVTNVAGSTNSAPTALGVSAPPALSSGQANGNLVLSATTVAGLTYVEYTTSDIQPPVVWTPVLTNVTPPNGVVQLTNRITNSGQFFRLAFP
jgi:hypothetical protein